MAKKKRIAGRPSRRSSDAAPVRENQLPHVDRGRLKMRVAAKMLRCEAALSTARAEMLLDDFGAVMVQLASVREGLVGILRDLLQFEEAKADYALAVEPPT